MFTKTKQLSKLNTILWRLEQNISKFEKDGIILWEGLEDIVRECEGDIDSFKESTNIPSQVKYANMLVQRVIITELLES